MSATLQKFRQKVQVLAYNPQNFGEMRLLTWSSVSWTICIVLVCPEVLADLYRK
ncbi:MAG: hypothetical protein V7K38_19590 [Nostoc sp.]|uniref:hypothetical protein n=1 Tax=Nostoc sp. TaxID=1180 RepID=UPI002FF60AF0